MIYGQTFQTFLGTGSLFILIFQYNRGSGMESCSKCHVKQLERKNHRSFAWHWALVVVAHVKDPWRVQRLMLIFNRFFAAIM